MVAKNPLLSGGGRKWSIVKRFNATVINDIWPETLFFTLVATMVALVSAKTSTSLAISNQMLTVLGTVLGLVVSFRTSSAYDRYWEGRRLWTSINLTSRSISHLIWIHVSNDRVDKAAAKLADGSQPKVPPVKVIIEKKSMVTLVQAFSVAVKHALRGEPGIYYTDLYPLVSFLPCYASSNPDDEHSAELLPMWISSGGIRPPASRAMSSAGGTINGLDGILSEKAQTSSLPIQSRANTMTFKKKKFNPEGVLPDIPSHVPLMPARMPPRAEIYDYLPVFLVFKPIMSFFRHIAYKLRMRATDEDERGDRERDGLGRKIKPEVLESSIPLEITLFLSSYLQWLLANGLLQPAIATAFTNGINSFQDAMAQLDRIRSTPIPYAYQAHLRMSMWLYLFFLPFQIYNAFGYLTIPATAFGSFLLLGFLEIGQEIENPFNYDLNDLDLDDFCLTIQREICEITAHPAPNPHSYIFGDWNQPFAPTDRRSAAEIIASVERATSASPQQDDSGENVDEFGVANSNGNNRTQDRERTLIPETGGAYGTGNSRKGSAMGAPETLEGFRETLLKNWREVSDRTIEHPKKLPKYKSPSGGSQV